MKTYALLTALGLLATACTTNRPAPPTAAGPAGPTASASPAPEKLPKPEPKPEPANRLDVLRSRGVDFVASGNEPFWALEITSQGQLRFRTAAGDSLRLPLPAPDQAQDADVLRYRAQSATDELIITVARRPCPNSMSGEVLPYTVAVRRQTAGQPTAREFAGCGRYLGDYRLHDLWALESIDGQAVVAADFTRDKPRLELNLTSGQVLGFGGCNGFAGSLVPERAGLRLGTLRGTMLACPALPFEQKFRKALEGQAFTYRLENRRLTLINRTNTLVFRKFD